jgi:cytidylate kinase
MPGTLPEGGEHLFVVKPTTIAIDGPVASGKTAVGRLLAQRLAYRFLDTGLMYRAVTWLALEEGVDLAGSEHLARLVQAQHMEVAFEDGNQVSFLIGNKDVTPNLRLPEVERGVSQVARIPAVREEMVTLQRRIGREGRVVMVGRDIGTVVLPDAPLKVFLTAAVEERARRRHQELQGLGATVEYERVLTELQQRDRLDSERAIAPLRPADDATVLTTGGLSVQDVVEWVVSLLEEST